MGTQIRIDLGDEPPLQGTGQNMSGHVEPGLYTLQIDSLAAEDVRNQPGEQQMVLRMHVIGSDALNDGTPIIERFRVPSPASPQTIGIRRFHAFLKEIGLRIEDPHDVTFDPDAFIGKKISAELADNLMPASGNFQERLISRVDSFHKIVKAAASAAPASSNGTSNGASARQAAQAAPQRQQRAAVATQSTMPEMTREEFESLDDQEEPDLAEVAAEVDLFDE